MTAIVGQTGGIKSRAIKRRDPVAQGLIAGTTRQEGRTTNLIPQVSSLLKRRFKVRTRNG